jgi:hypothetical protein
LGRRAVGHVASASGVLGPVPSEPPATAAFRALGREGLAAALDTLERLASRDSLVLRDGHQLAHALGRQALAAGGDDPRILAQCRPVFASGCYHGVIEAYLNARHRIDMAELERMCRIGGAQLPGNAYECVHGVGHGVLGVHALDVRAALRDCDALSTSRFRASCREGVFMEAINSAVRPAGMRAHNHAETSHHGHEGRGEPTGAGRLTVNPGDPYSPCDGFGEPYAASCWLFQPFVILKRTGFDAAEGFRICDRAPADRAGRCYEGMGLQLTGLFQREEGWSVEQCAKGRAALAPYCAAGAALALTGGDWSGARAARFCAAAPEAWKKACYGSAASLLRDVATKPQRIAMCATVEPRYLPLCREAAGLDTAGDPTSTPD